MNNSLTPLTRFVLGVSAIVLLVFALVDLFAPGLLPALLWSPPFQPPPDLWLRYDGTITIAMCLGAILAFRQNDWHVARLYLVMAGVWVGLELLLSILSIATMPVPFMLWVYSVSAIIYLPLVVLAWRQQSAR